jgi:hypothetical protein
LGRKGYACGVGGHDPLCCSRRHGDADCGSSYSQVGRGAKGTGIVAVATFFFLTTWIDIDINKVGYRFKITNLIEGGHCFLAPNDWEILKDLKSGAYLKFLRASKYSF